MTTGRETASGLMAGAPVLTRDGHRLGTVKETRGPYFKVDAPMQPDYWLSLEQIATVDRGMIGLTFNKDDLGDYKMSDPAERGINGEGGQARPRGDVPPAYPPTTVGTVSGFSGHDWGEAGPSYRRFWESQPDVPSWDEVQPAFHYAHTMRGQERYRDRDWEGSERDLSAEYAEWCRQQGYQVDDSSWQRHRGYVQNAWTRDQSGPRDEGENRTTVL
jgi:hypothetical protein